MAKPKSKHLVPLTTEQYTPQSHSKDLHIAPQAPTPTYDATPTAAQPAQDSAGDAQGTQEDIGVALLDAPGPEDDGRARAYEIGCRLQRDGRWREISPIRDRMMQEARSRGMDKDAARAWAYGELDRLYPPLPQPEAPVEVTPPAETEVMGVYLVPAAWPAMGAASLQVELSWVQNERLRVVETVGQRTTVHLDRASTPAPSMSALGWLETSIRSYAKYIDVLARAMQGQQDEADSVRRERMRIEDIDSLLRELCSEEQGKR